jgi:hypothetical protein
MTRSGTLLTTPASRDWNATISSGLYRFLAIAVLLDVKDIPQVGPLQRGWIKVINTAQTPTSRASRVG